MKDDVTRLDAPLDYRAIWGHLKARLRAIAGEEAQRAATEKDEMLVRRSQGGYNMALRVIAEMNNMVDHERNPGVVEDQDDNLH